MFKHLKIQAAEENIELKSQTIHCDFEKGAIKAIKYHFPTKQQLKDAKIALLKM